MIYDLQVGSEENLSVVVAQRSRAHRHKTQDQMLTSLPLHPISPDFLAHLSHNAGLDGHNVGASTTTCCPVTCAAQNRSAQAAQACLRQPSTCRTGNSKEQALAWAKIDIRLIYHSVPTFYAKKKGSHSNLTRTVSQHLESNRLRVIYVTLRLPRSDFRKLHR